MSEVLDRVKPKVQPPSQAAWAEYERRKQEWRLANPSASYDDYERAVKRILRELGL